MMNAWISNYLIGFLLLLGSIQASEAKSLNIKNFREILYGLEYATGVDAKDEKIQTVYKLVMDRLPQKGKVEEFSNSMLLAVTELAGVFCAQAAEKAALKADGTRDFFNWVNFEMGPKQFFGFQREMFLKELVSKVWGIKATKDELTVVRELLEKTDFSADATQTPKVLISTCTTLITSLNFLVRP